MKRHFTVSPKLSGRRVTASNNIPETLKGSIINERLETLCHWPPRAIDDAYIDEDEDYTFEETESELISACRMELDPEDAVDCGRECAKAIFENRKSNF